MRGAVVLRQRVSRGDTEVDLVDGSQPVGTLAKRYQGLWVATGVFDRDKTLMWLDRQRWVSMTQTLQTQIGSGNQDEAGRRVQPWALVATMVRVGSRPLGYGSGVTRGTIGVVGTGLGFAVTRRLSNSIY